MNENPTELLPCPFCGGRAEISKQHWSHRDYWGTVCQGDCGIFMDSRSPTKADALAKWNNRHPTPPASEPSEQPNAEDAELYKVGGRPSQEVLDALEWYRSWRRGKLLIEADYNWDEEHAVAEMLSDYARHTAAKAVADERQRLARLVDAYQERLNIITGLLESNFPALGMQSQEALDGIRDIVREFDALRLSFGETPIGEGGLAGEGENA